MRPDKKLKLNVAVKEFYKTEPLSIDLAATVANKVFPDTVSYSFDTSRIGYVIAATVASIILSVLFINFQNYLLRVETLVLLIPIISYFWLTAKEVNMLSKKILGLR